MMSFTYACAMVSASPGRTPPGRDVVHFTRCRRSRALDPFCLCQAAAGRGWLKPFAASLKEGQRVAAAVRGAAEPELPLAARPVLHRVGELPDGFWYSVKRRVLGPPLVTEQLKDERLSKPLALGVLSCDGLSSAAYGTEEILYALLPFFGLAAFTLVLPMTLLVLFGVVLVVLSYREVVSVYTRAGGSYVVARENFGPRVAQVAAVALLIDYVVTVAVQTAAGSAAIVSAFPALSAIPFIGPKILLVISVTAIGDMCLANLRGLREAGRIFALPTYLFEGSVVLMIVTGVARELTGGLPHVVTGSGTVHIGSHSGLIAFGALYIMARAFASGGSSLTGIEAVSNAVSALRPPEGRNALHRRVPDRARAGGRARLRVHPGRADHVLHAPGGHRRGLVHRWQHQLHRVPVPGQFRGRGLLPAPLADPARPPAGVLQRDHPAGRAVADADAGGGRDRGRADPVLRYRRVHRVRHGRVRHGQVPPADPGAGLAAAAGDQYGRRDLHRARRAAVRGGEVHRGRVADRDLVPGAGVRAHPAQPAVPDRDRDQPRAL